MKYELQRSFSSGELSELVHMRNDYGDIYDAGLSILNNMIPDPRGPALDRGGFSFEEEIVGETDVFFVKFKLSAEDVFRIIIGTNDIWINDPLAEIIDTGTEYITNPSFDIPAGAGWTDINVSLPTDYSIAGTARIQASTTFGTGGIQQAITLPIGTATYIITVIQDSSEVYDLNINMNSTNPFAEKTGLNTFFQKSFIPNDTAFTVSISINAPSTTTVYSKVLQVNIHPVIPGAVGNFLKFISPYNSTNIKNIQFEMVPGESSLFIVSKGTTPIQITKFEDSNIWDMQDIPFNPPVLVTDIDMSKQLPGALGFYGGRLVLGDVKIGSETILMSRPNAYGDFNRGGITTPAADDPIEFTINKKGIIEWIKENEDLIIGMDSSEHLITATGGTITAIDAGAKQQSENGSSGIRSVIIDGQFIYVDVRRKKIRSAQYNDFTQKWSSVDISFLSAHLLSSGILELNYHVGEYTLVLHTLNNGNAVIAVFNTALKTIGWANIITDGDILSTTITEESGESIINILVSRNGKIFLEKQNIIPEYMDSWLSTATSVIYGQIFYISGFDHLEGLDVQILIDDIVHPNRIVGAESELGAADGVLGRIYITFTGANHVAGLQYIPRLVPMPKIVENQEGNDFMHEKTYSEIAVKLLDSRRPIINGSDTFERSPGTPQGESEPAKTELLIVGSDGWDQDALIDVSQPLPYKLDIAAIGGQYAAKKL